MKNVWKINELGGEAWRQAVLNTAVVVGLDISGIFLDGGVKVVNMANALGVRFTVDGEIIREG